MEKIKARIKKLLALAETSTNAGEAKSALSKAIKLMRKYQIEQGQLEGGEVVTIKYQHRKLKIDKWENLLLGGISSTLGVYAVICQGWRDNYQGNQKAELIFTGLKADIELTKYVLDIAIRIINNKTTEYRKQHTVPKDAGGMLAGVCTLPPTVQKNYREGLAVGFNIRFKQENQAQAQAGEGKGLIPVDTRKQNAEDFYLSSNKKPRTSRLRDLEGLAARKGVVDGKQITINKGVDGEKAQAALPNLK